jgi:hypothetical protein
MQKILNWLNQPYPFEKRWPQVLRIALWAGVFVTLFLFFLKPFGTQIREGAEWIYLRYCALFGLVTASVVLIVNTLCLLLPVIFNEEKWRVWKEILFNIFFIGCIGFGNLLLAHSKMNVPLDAKSFWTWQGFTFAVGIFPALIGALLKQMKLNKKYAAEAAQISRQVHPNTNSARQTVILTGDNQNETLRLDAGQIAYLSAADNYVQVFFFENEALKSQMLRATLKKMEDALAACPRFFRCHRTYIVNLEKVEKVSGNAQGYRLHLEGVEATVPVSRNLNEAIKEKLRKV